jgi:drug/metabolite transporter (DMT)-like permease
MSLILAVVWGSSFLWIAIAIDHVPVTVVPLGRCVFGALALAVIPESRRRIERVDWGRFALTGLMWMGIPFLLYPIAERTVSTSITGMINGALPIVTVVVTAMFTRTMPSAFRVAAVLIGGFGIALISLSSIGSDKSADAKGIGLLLVALVCYAIAANLARPLQARHGPLPTMLWIELAAIAWSLPLGVHGLATSDFSWQALGALVMLGAVGTGFAFALYGVLLQRAGTVRGMIGIFFTPIVGALLGVTFRDDHLRPAALVGMGIVILGAIMTSRPDV